MSFPGVKIRFVSLHKKIHALKAVRSSESVERLQLMTTWNNSLIFFPA